VLHFDFLSGVCAWPGERTDVDLEGAQHARGVSV
jgi:hypothetical protein